MRCIRLLHEWEVGEKKLVVRVDAKTKQLLDNYKVSSVSVCACVSVPVRVSASACDFSELTEFWRCTGQSFSTFGSFLKKNDFISHYFPLYLPFP